MIIVKPLFTKVLPFTLLLCMICFGIDIIFPNMNVTYLTHTTINGSVLYQFDFTSYFQNLSIDLLKKATTNLIDTETFKNIVETWKTIWEDGYDLGDMFKTIVNGFIMVIDAFLTIINLIIVILRIIIAILLLGMSVIGINISNPNSTILKALNDIVKSLTIDLVQPWAA